MTLSAALRDKEWLARPYWPTYREKAKACQKGLPGLFLRVSREANPEFRDIVDLISPHICQWLSAVMEAAFLCREMGRNDALLAHDLVAALMDRERRGHLLSRLAPKRLEPMGRLEAGFRHVARTLSWSRPGTFRRNLFSPRTLAIAHNSLLVETARGVTDGIGFFHGSHLLDIALKNYGKSLAGKTESVLEFMLPYLSWEESFPEWIISACRDLMAEIIRCFAERAERDLAALSGVPLPGRIWTGTFTPWVSRAIGLSVLARQGEVHAFDHGGGVGNNASGPSHFLHLEICRYSVFVATSALAADMYRKRLLDDGVGKEQVLAGPGDPSFRAVPRRAIVRQKKKQVVYAPTVFYGFRQYSLYLLPDPVYMHWQRQVLESLARMPVTPLFKPHPEGLLRGQVNPLSGIVPTSTALFENHLQDGDVFVFDYVHSTTFWKALCGDGAVVLFDLGTSHVIPEMRALIEKRARVINVEFEAGIPVWDANLFSDAILTASPEDPTPFRVLCGGEEGNAQWPWPNA
ncbi:MAG: hypothetical protein LBF61_01675 [Azoarcus sp.]|jgi:hypothetical protein|nr:hypothetical protein [Azoarcus sp.]